MKVKEKTGSRAYLVMVCVPVHFHHKKSIYCYLFSTGARTSSGGALAPVGPFLEPPMSTGFITTHNSVERIVVNPNAAYNKFIDQHVGTKGLGQFVFNKYVAWSIFFSVKFNYFITNLFIVNGNGPQHSKHLIWGKIQKKKHI